MLAIVIFTVAQYFLCNGVSKGEDEKREGSR